MQEKETTNHINFSDLRKIPAAGRILALDLGTKRVGVAVCDEMQVTTRPLPFIVRRSWKELLKTVVSLIEEFDAAALVLGLPFNFDGSESEMSADARRLARNFSLSLSVPVFLQDERLTSRAARDQLHERGLNHQQIRRRIDGEAAATILGDFLALKSEANAREDDRKNETERE